MENKLPKDWDEILDNKFAEYKVARTDRYPGNPAEKLFDDYLVYGNLKLVSEKNNIPFAWIKRIAKQHNFAARSDTYWIQTSKIKFVDDVDTMFNDVIVFYHIIGYSNEEINDKIQDASRWDDYLYEHDYRRRIRCVIRHAESSMCRDKKRKVPWYMTGLLTYVLAIYRGDCEDPQGHGHYMEQLNRMHGYLHWKAISALKRYLRENNLSDYAAEHVLNHCFCDDY